MTTSKPSNKPINAPVRMAKLTEKEIARAVEKAQSRAEVYARDPRKARELLNDAMRKAERYESNAGPLAEVWSYLTAFFRLLKAFIRRDYRDIQWASIVLVIAALIYFVWPLELIPDILPGGLFDDAAVFAFVIARTKAELDNFLAWELERSNAESESEEDMLELA